MLIHHSLLWICVIVSHIRFSVLMGTCPQEMVYGRIAFMAGRKAIWRA